MSNFARDIEGAAGSERIEAVVIGGHGWRRIDDEDHVEGRKMPVRRGEVLSWGDARPMLDYEYDTGFGGAGCDAIWAWTPTRVLFVSQYDGATGVESVPRNPQPGAPDMPGG